MKKSLIYLVLIFVLSLSGCSTSQEYRNLDTEVKDVIAEMISQMQRALYADMVNQFFDPKYVEQYGTATVVNDYRFEQSDYFFRALRTCEQINPTINTSTSLVTFNHPNFLTAINFKKVGGRWFYMPE